ncbi:MAG TPA: hypothetical protein VFT66_13040 [Roseiflexaceae bacterium]|jgi:hypothetical protein|nr:hypothetical protein [Roseiflexaceae bacterium]
MAAIAIRQMLSNDFADVLALLAQNGLPDAVPLSVQQSVEFTEACLVSALVLALKLK